MIPINKKCGNSNDTVKGQKIGWYLLAHKNIIYLENVI